VSEVNQLKCDGCGKRDDDGEGWAALESGEDIRLWRGNTSPNAKPERETRIDFCSRACAGAFFFPGPEPGEEVDDVPRD
jgi:hypothetical protein